MARLQGYREKRPRFLYDTITVLPGGRINLFGLTRKERIGNFSLTNMIVDGEACSDQDFFLHEIVTERFSGSILCAKVVLLTLNIGDQPQIAWFAGAPSFPTWGPDASKVQIDEFTMVQWSNAMIPIRQNFHVVAESSAPEPVTLRVTLRGVSIWRVQ